MKNKFIHNRDKEVTQHPDFENNHIYLIRGEQNPQFKSVTTFLKKFFPQFKAKEIIDRYYNTWQKNPTNKYYNMTKEDIAQSWEANAKEKSHRGTKIHLMIENHYEKGEIYNIPEFRQFQQFQKENPTLFCVRTEHIIFDDESSLVGTVDALFQDENGDYHIIDWKTNKLIQKDNCYEFGYYPLSHIPHSNFWHYTLQLNVYKYIYEKNYGIKIKGLYLCHIKPDNVKLIKLENLQKEVNDLLFE